jgi:hypothetical protein
MCVPMEFRIFGGQIDGALTNCVCGTADTSLMWAAANVRQLGSASV